MTRLLRHFVSSVLILSSLGCAEMQIADIRPHVTLPYSEDCFGINVLSHTEVRTPKLDCDELKKRAVFLTSDDWKLLRISIQKNCQVLKCKQLVGALDDLFLAVDKGLQLVPLP